jgi:CDP-diacylglycerol--glycerol-3-phosphate 3-phosphatidyltransferase
VAERERRVRPSRRAFWADAVNLPNALTMGRIVLIPLVLWFVGEGTPRGALLAAWTWAALSVTDFLDGFLARKLNIESVVGKFLDPLADKLLVMALLIYMVPMGRIAAWVVVVLLGRELAITGLRSIASSEGIVIGAGSGGKWKTAIQMVGILCLILHFPHRVVPFYSGLVDLNVVGQWLVLLSLVFSLTSAVEYSALFAAGIEAKEKRDAAEDEASAPAA